MSKNMDILKSLYLEADNSCVEWLDFILEHEEDELHGTVMEMSDDELTAFLVWAGSDDWMVTGHETVLNPDYFIDLAKTKWEEVLADEVKEWKKQGYIQSKDEENVMVNPVSGQKIYPSDFASQVYDSCLTPEEVAGYYLWTRENKEDALKDWFTNTDGIKMSEADLKADALIKEICKLTRKEIVDNYNSRAIYFERSDGSTVMAGDNEYSLEYCLQRYNEGCNFYFD